MEDLDQLESILKILFRRFPAQEVLENCGRMPGISKEKFVNLAYPYTSTKETNQYTKDELFNQWEYYFEQMEQEGKKRGLYLSSDNRLNPMDCLFFYVKRMLAIQDNEVVCRYERLLEWQMLTLDISETLLVSAFWATQKEPDQMTEHDFSWKTVLGHDNYQLNRILSRDMAENHFHLYGSAPIFDLSWISLMNRPLNATAGKKLNDYDHRRMDDSRFQDAAVLKVPLRLQVYQAALIRLLLFSVVSKTRIKIGSYCVKYQDYQSMLKSDINTNLVDEDDYIELEALEEFFLPEYRPVFQEIWNRRTLENVQVLLHEEYQGTEYHLYQLQGQIADIQGTIEVLRHQYYMPLTDYTLLAVTDQYMEENEIFEGERWLLHYCFYEIYHRGFDKYAGLFYAYLLLKESLRHELIQTDDKVGFSHFQDYERRKFDLLDDAIFHGVYGTLARSAVRENLLNPSIVSLEIRVSPLDTAEGNLKLVKQLDQIMGGSKDRYFYTVHFLKRADNWKEKNEDPLSYRHYDLRKRIQKQANALVRMRELYPDYAKRILGIDAAAKEIVCRPEVFATPFRFLHKDIKIVDNGYKTSEPSESSEYSEYSKHGKYSEYSALPQLRRTFHVGEEFEDIVDGLRAIDEAVNFLELESGDRIGHGLALGIDAEEWYNSKSHSITISRQNYLDNVVWLYHQLVRFNLAGTEALREYLKNEFSIIFAEVYLKHINQRTVHKILEEYNKNQKNSGQSTHINDQCNFDIAHYYQAWKLRGDSPDLYSRGYFYWFEGETPLEDAKVAMRFPRHFDVRYIPEAFLLNYFYHYSKEVREAGTSMIKKKVTPLYVEGTLLVQKALQREIGRKGIAIETNPTSNFRIGTINRYDKHPILTFYNRELETDPDKLQQCPQLLVSINTDDQGVFSTSLENEYSLMACALEKKKDANSHYLYPKQRIYAWLDEIRKMGLDQSFLRK